MSIKRIISIIFVIVLITGVFSGCGEKDGETLSYGDKFIGDDKGEDEDDGLLQGPLGASGKKVYEYDGFLGCGYNVIDSPYYQSEDVRQCVLDVESMAEDGLIYEELNSQTSTVFSVEAGESIYSYMNSLAISVGMTTKSLFGGSLKMDFGLDTSSKLDEKKSFAKGSATLIRSKQYVQMTKVSYRTLRNKYVYDAFLEDYLLNDKYPVKDLFTNFGTHIMLTVYLGGRLDMCYVYNNTAEESTLDIKTKVEASFSLVEGTSSTDLSEKSSSLVNNSSFRVNTYGGKVDVNTTSLENAKANYSEWAKSVQDAEFQVLIKAGRLDATSEMIPIWMLIDPDASEANKNRYNDIMNEFDKQLEIAGSKLGQYQTEPLPVYIKDIYIGSKSGRDGKLAISDLKRKTTEEVIIIEKDLNRNAGGHFIYIGYTTTTDPSDAIRGLTLRFGSGPPDTFYHAGAYYTVLKDNDLNKGAGGNDIFLCYTKNKDIGGPIKNLFVEINGDSSGKSGEGWSMVGDWKRPSDLYDLNRDAGGDDIFLWMQK